ncbi:MULTISPECIES: hypothetical protein [Bacillus cereus group]|uniref:hypothetical protein n=1 Tax=Bacillus cereus group TaxID=86661 RepID=UPI001F587CF5|nr:MULTISPECIES: hypothetical protein [Bacillus cereus group]MDA1545263.1 hypothetical protein [Bacillus cereus group sp. TH253LC]MDA1627999.1 hypothetical protein [Bacillus cereus group sp. TH172LC]MDA1838219.1 hypothetical protein [Bacillus cereus group sp. BY17LC]MEC3470889.1 hypothetical protein [Bacillus tropicus]
MDKYNFKNIDDGIRILLPFDIRNIVGAFVWFIMNFLLLIIIFVFPPIYNVYFYLALPFFIVCNLWGIWIFINKPKQPQLQHLLYSGFVGTSISFCSFIGVQKIAYELIGLESPLFFILSFIVYCLVVYKSGQLWIKYFTARLMGINDQKVNFSKVGVFSGVGYIVGQISIGILSQDSLAILLIILLSFFSIIFLFASVHMYFYFDFKKHLIITGHSKMKQVQQKSNLTRKERRRK